MDDAEKKTEKVSYNYTANMSILEEENRILKETVITLRNELAKYQKAPLLLSEVKEVIDSNVTVKLPNGNEFFVEVGTNVEKLKAGDSVLLEQKNLTVVRKLGTTSRFNVEKFVIMEKPT